MQTTEELYGMYPTNQAGMWGNRERTLQQQELSALYGGLGYDTDYGQSFDESGAMARCRDLSFDVAQNAVRRQVVTEY